MPVRALTIGLAALALVAWPGCSVPQPRGNGLQTREIEPSTKRGYWLYLPEDYVKMDEAARRERRWPVVVTFHGMKPFDNAKPQALEWQQEADRYGYIAIAPELRAPDVLRQFPVRTVTPAFKSDELATLAILDHVFATTEADPSNVLSTSFSSGGYMAHYMMNQYPSRFTALVARQSNFSSTILDPVKSPRSRYHPILITNTQKDFKICMTESAEAVRWYEDHGYSNVWWIKIRKLMHVRTPDIAADFFGRVAGVGPSRPSRALATREIVDGNPAGIAMLAGKLPEFQHPPNLVAAAVIPAMKNPAATPTRNVAGTNMRRVQVSPFRAGGRLPDTVVQRPSGSTPTRRRTAPPALVDRNRVSVRVSYAVGIDPFYVGFSVDCPSDWLRTAKFDWALDGKELCRGVNGSTTLTKPGTYDLSVLVTTAGGAQHRAAKSVRVLPKLRRIDSSSGND